MKSTDSRGKWKHLEQFKCTTTSQYKFKIQNHVTLILGAMEVGGWEGVTCSMGVMVFG